MNPKLLISNYFDSLVNLIDIHTEEQLLKSSETDLITNKLVIGDSSGSVKVIDFINNTRDKLFKC